MDWVTERGKGFFMSLNYTGHLHESRAGRGSVIPEIKKTVMRARKDRDAAPSSLLPEILFSK